MTAQATGLGSRLKEAREGLGLSRRSLAIKLKVSSEAIRKIERGITKSPRARLLCALARELNVTPNYLIHGQELQETPTAIRRPVIRQTEDLVIEVNLPYRVTLGDQDLEELARRLAVEFELIRERRNAMPQSCSGTRVRDEI